MIAGWDSLCALQNLLSNPSQMNVYNPRTICSCMRTAKTVALLIFILGQRDPRSHGQDVGLGSRFVLVVEPHGAVGPEVICVSGFGGIAAFDAVVSAPGRHFALAVEDKINFFRDFMMMRKVRAAGREVYQKKTGHDIRLIDGVTLSGAWTEQKFIENRCGMPFDGFFLEVVHVDNLRFRRRAD